MQTLRRIPLALAAVALLLASLTAASAHHGWRWAEGENSELTGTITAVKLGNPHGELTMDAEGGIWTVEIGQPWRNDRVGLTPELLAIGTEVTISGHKSANPDEKLMKAERVIIAGKTYDLYPDRD